MREIRTHDGQNSIGGGIGDIPWKGSVWYGELFLLDREIGSALLSQDRYETVSGHAQRSAR